MFDVTDGSPFLMTLAAASGSPSELDRSGMMVLVAVKIFTQAGDQANEGARLSDHRFSTPSDCGV